MFKIVLSILIFCSVAWGDAATYVDNTLKASPLVYGAYKTMTWFVRYDSRLAAQKIRVQLFSAKHGGKDVIVVFKDSRLLYYVKDGRIVRDDNWEGFEFDFPVRIALGSRSYYWTPEGEYYICQKNPYSRFIKFLGISYPNINDARLGLEKGMISKYQYEAIVRANLEKKTPPWFTSLGGRFGVHSYPTQYKWLLRAKEKENPNLTYVTRKDFTEGCVGVENRVVEYLYAHVEEGTPILILP